MRNSMGPTAKLAGSWLLTSLYSGILSRKREIKKASTPGTPLGLNERVCKEHGFLSWLWALWSR